MSKAVWVANAKKSYCRAYVKILNKYRFAGDIAHFAKRSKALKLLRARNLIRKRQISWTSSCIRKTSTATTWFQHMCATWWRASRLRVSLRLRLGCRWHRRCFRAWHRDEPSLSPHHENPRTTEEGKLYLLEIRPKSPKYTAINESGFG